MDSKATEEALVAMMMEYEKTAQEEIKMLEEEKKASYKRAEFAEQQIEARVKNLSKNRQMLTDLLAREAAAPAALAVVQDLPAPAATTASPNPIANADFPQAQPSNNQVLASRHQKKRKREGSIEIIQKQKIQAEQNQEKVVLELKSTIVPQRTEPEMLLVDKELLKERNKKLQLIAIINNQAMKEEFIKMAARRNELSMAKVIARCEAEKAAFKRSEEAIQQNESDEQRYQMEDAVMKEEMAKEDAAKAAAKEEKLQLQIMSGKQTLLEEYIEMQLSHKEFDNEPHLKEDEIADADATKVEGAAPKKADDSSMVAMSEPNFWDKAYLKMSESRNGVSKAKAEAQGEEAKASVAVAKSNASVAKSNASVAKSNAELAKAQQKRADTAKQQNEFDNARILKEDAFVEKKMAAAAKEEAAKKAAAGPKPAPHVVQPTGTTTTYRNDNNNN